VVGDRHQLPPTEYFTASASSSDLENVVDAESILDFFYINGVPETTLLWHYRSQHHSLIAPSNHEFYNNELIAFPSSQVRSKKLGVSLVYIPNSVYDRGREGTRTNLVEARHVASAVMQHAQNDPNLSLGVVALNREQAEAIEHEINLLRDQNPSCEDFFQEEDRFFVTNLEHVQGDERDVIFISIGFGFSKDGRLTLQFGPISQQGGERRLNVLTTRARRQCVVFSSIRGRDLYERNPSNRGAQFLAEYLEYAEKGVMRNYEEIQRTLQSDKDYTKVNERLIKLMSIFNEKFTVDELKTFCVHFSIDLENISGDTRIAKARELAFHFQRRFHEWAHHHQ
jgi:superfamily I DNA and/or RNA helicase